MSTTTSGTTASPTITINGLHFQLEAELGAFSASVRQEEIEPGLDLLHLRLSAPQPAQPPKVVLMASLPIADSHHAWATSGQGHGFGLVLDARVTARACSQAPVLCLHSLHDRNRCTLALSDGLHQSVIQSREREEDATHRLRVEVFERALPATADIAVTLRIDRRDVPYHRALREVAAWWAGQDGYTPIAAPEAGRLPMYSTWYSFHQQVPADVVEAQCVLAKAIGCEAVIMDDGWQTLDNARGYAYTGDWNPDRIPDMAAHVARVHAMGLKYLLWYSVPFVGYQAVCYEQFKDMGLRNDERLQTLVLDPRFPAVREYLISHYERAVREWNVDGLKLDFVDSFSGEPDASNGRDFADVDEAADRLLSDCIDCLRAIKPDILIEFRQSYIGPKMRRYGNLFRAGDCPYCVITNRKRTIDLRLLSGDTCVHSDMFRWHESEDVASAAQQILAVIFSVPQVSVLIQDLPPDHRTMLTFWLAWWTEHRATLLDGELDPRRPDQGYPVVVAQSDSQTIAAVYGEQLLRLDAPRTDCQIVNASRYDAVALDLGHDLGERQVTVRDCCGVVVAQETRALGAGLHRIAVPPAGLVQIRCGASGSAAAR
ncbi:MAG: alpha-galactosidase [Planctomycetota bacterium]|jgi:alpha-galactosidase|nr:alpha-galactosidase [Planctomycetota bacterium]